MRKSQYFEILPEISWQNSSTLRSPNSEPPRPNEPKKCYGQLHSISSRSFCLAERIALGREEEEKKEVRIISWRAMFGVKYLKNP